MSQVESGLAQALVIYLGFGSAAWPQADKNAIEQEFGDRSNRILDQITAILREAEQFAPDWSTHDLASAKDSAEEQVRIRHPELTEDAIKAVAWAWSYWNK
jgi:hypothetical protein